MWSSGLRRADVDVSGWAGQCTCVHVCACVWDRDWDPPGGSLLGGVVARGLV